MSTTHLPGATDASGRDVSGGAFPGHHPGGPGRADPRAPEPRPPAAKPIVPYVPTADTVVAALLDLAEVGPGDVLYDLGCGDGRIVIGAAKRGARGVGVDIDRLRVREGNWNAERAGVTDRVRFERASLFDVDLRPATVVALYLLPSINRRLRPKLLRELTTGSRIVSNFFDMDDWQPDRRIEAWGKTLYLWVVPAWLEGTWKGVVNHPDGRHHMVLRLRRKYQKAAGMIQLGRREVLLDDGRIDGRRLTFAYADPATGRRVRCSAELVGPYLRGTLSSGADDARPCAWAARRAK